MEGPDTKGLIFKVTKTLFQNDCNIVRQDEYVSPNSWFFMRTEFESEKELDTNLFLNKLTSEINNQDINFRISSKAKKNIVVFATKEHHCLSDILIRHYFNEINANILAVISNYEDLNEIVSKFNIPYFHVPTNNVSKENQEAEIIKILSSFKADYLVLAKYMRILSPEFVERYQNKIINIHHSFLPAFIGSNPYKQAYTRGVKLIGATAHFVTDDLDEGPIIAQNTKKVNHKFTSKDMAKKGKEVEKATLIKALNLVFDDRVFIYGNKTIIL